MSNSRTMTRQYSEYSDFFSTQREYEMQTSLRGSPLRSDGVDRTGREPDSGLGCTQDHRTWWTGDAWVDPDSFAQKTEQPAGRKRRAGGRLAVKRIPDGTVLRRDNQWDIPRKRALFISDGPDMIGLRR